MRKKGKRKIDKKDFKRKKRSRIFSHLLYHIMGLGAVTIFGKFSIGQSSWYTIPIAIFLLVYYIIYFGAYLLERIAIQHNYQRSLFWLLGKFLSVIVNLALTFTYCYILMYYTYPDSMKDTSILGTGVFEKFLTFFHFSLGNFLGMDSQIIVTGAAFKIIQIIQSLTTFCLLIFLFSNYTDIKKGYSEYYEQEE